MTISIGECSRIKGEVCAENVRRVSGGRRRRRWQSAGVTGTTCRAADGTMAKGRATTTDRVVVAVVVVVARDTTTAGR